MQGKFLTEDFFARDVLAVAPELVGKLLVRRNPETGEALCVRISETEAYRGEADTACHAHCGRTKRNALLYGKPGVIYVYLCYGIHWLMNMVTGEEGEPQAVLLRAGVGYAGPARLTKFLGIDGRLNGMALCGQDEIRIVDDGERFAIRTAPRVGIDYAAEEDRQKPWRFILEK